MLTLYSFPEPSLSERRPSEAAFPAEHYREGKTGRDRGGPRYKKLCLAKRLGEQKPDRQSPNAKLSPPLPDSSQRERESSCHADPAPLSQRNITVSYDRRKRRGELANTSPCYRGLGPSSSPAQHALFPRLAIYAPSIATRRRCRFVFFPSAHSAAAASIEQLTLLARGCRGAAYLLITTQANPRPMGAAGSVPVGLSGLCCGSESDSTSLPVAMTSLGGRHSSSINIKKPES
ncbi:unnamed protein product [Pleuronectes platessa]|uniref:Uncharacterized protein n=1 Tax=Pleuronectes platessa TaxID=8262 RepID=A0A9N7TWC2_PLEPL|nr:unnamed protein product [Pleuronectes platessa]